MTDQPLKAWICPVCGYIHYGAEPPEECPLCGTPKDQFELVPEAQPAPTRWVCPNCGYIHEGSQPPHECPICGAAAAVFEPEEAGTPAAVPAGWDGKIVIVGAGIAGVSAAEAAHKTAPWAEVVLLSSEPHLPYYRLSLTRYLAGEVDSFQLDLHPHSWYEQNGIQLRLNVTVCEIDPGRKTLVLDDGQRISYDRLILTVGSHPFLPPFPGADRKNVTTLRTRQDADMILAASRAHPQVVCIGGGLLGLETAGALARQGADVTLLENMAWLLPRQLNAAAGELLKKQIEKIGISVHTNARTRELVGDETVRGVLLEDGACLPADLVVVSAGVRANLNLARQAGIQVNQGILVDDAMQTSQPDVFAAGDASEHKGVLYGIWPPSQMQGAVAGRGAAGEPGQFGGIPRSNTLKVLGYDVLSIGKITPEGANALQIAAETDDTYACFVFRDGRMVGSILLGDTALASEVKQAVETGFDFSGVLPSNPGVAEIIALLKKM